MATYYSNPEPIVKILHNTSNLKQYYGDYIGNIYDPLLFEFRKRFGYIPKDSIRCVDSGKVYCNLKQLN